VCAFARDSIFTTGWAPFSATQKIMMAGRLTGVGCRRRSVECPSCLRHRFLSLREQAKGWRRFDRETLDALCARPRGREPGWTKKGILACAEHPRAVSPRTRPAEKTGRSIRCPARIRPLERSPIRSRVLGQRTGTSPSCLSSSRMPVFEPYPFSSPREADAAAFRRARRSASHPAMSRYSQSSDSCKGESENIYIGRSAAALVEIFVGNTRTNN
jgi:hypothetical protein